MLRIYLHLYNFNKVGVRCSVLLDLNVVGRSMLEFSHDLNAALHCARNLVEALDTASKNTPMATQNLPMFISGLQKIVSHMKNTFELLITILSKEHAIQQFPTRPAIGASPPLDSSRSPERQNDSSRLPQLPHRANTTLSSVVVPRTAMITHHPKPPPAVQDSPKVSDITAFAVSASLYFLLESSRKLMEADQAAVFLQRSVDDLQSICLSGGPPRPVGSVVLPVRVGIPGAVLKSGLALCASVPEPSVYTPHTLCFPLFESGSRRCTVGVVLFEKKSGDSFSSDDEGLALNMSRVATHYLTSYGVDIPKEEFDPHAVLKRGTVVGDYIRLGRSGITAFVKPVSSIVAPGVFPDMISSEAANAFDHADPLLRNGMGSDLANRIFGMAPPLLIFRAAHWNHGFNFRSSGYKGAGEPIAYHNLIDVASYVGSLDESWKRSKEELFSIEAEQITHLREQKERKRNARALQSRLSTAEAAAKAYMEKYDRLKSDITAIVGQ